MTASTRRHIAARLRALVTRPDEDWSVTARRLGVEEVALRMSLDTLSPFPTIDVLVAVVAHYGVDPSYLLTGEYDVSLHRELADADKAVLAVAISEYVSRQSLPVVARPTPERSNIRIA